MFRHHGTRLTSSTNFQQLYTARFVPLFTHLILLVLIFVYRVSYQNDKRKEKNMCLKMTYIYIY